MWLINDNNLKLKIIFYLVIRMNSLGCVGVLTCLGNRLGKVSIYLALEHSENINEMLTMKIDFNIKTSKTQPIKKNELI
ncbi:hypothetical protein SP90_08105 [Halodesulfovibrio spirochaetisodalis]|uniref:Uncharacterized protein n=1 Tax=Halodesulfovibrio spirochaetisodalis TaxID=1560234 RepID=A0A1B7XDL2_9BACT|nr:hypothetical protein SP90_08105 [Halodesulfovibrio spirochaetisodalis]